jgi:hypothetical protein
MVHAEDSLNGGQRRHSGGAIPPMGRGLAYEAVDRL